MQIRGEQSVFERVQDNDDDHDSKLSDTFLWCLNAAARCNRACLNKVTDTPTARLIDDRTVSGLHSPCSVKTHP